MINRKTIITIGMFDGIHCGHRYLLDNLANLADKLDMQQAVFTFSNHPLSIICPEKTPKLLMNASVKYYFINRDNRQAFLMECTKELLKMTAVEFILYIKNKFVNVHALLLGYNSSFGSDQPTAEQLSEQLAKYNIKVFTCEKYNKKEISSSFIRNEIVKGNIDAAKNMINGFLSINGKVVKGIKKGSEMGYPTANIEVDEGMIVPGPGVYAGICKGHPAMINIGSAPTIRKDGNITIEVHIIDYNSDLYGENLDVTFIERIREEKKFESIEDLIAQLSKDKQTSIDAFKRIKK